LHEKIHIGFTGLREILFGHFDRCADPRRRTGTYLLRECLMSAFAMMYFQDSSLLEFQRRFQVAKEKNNIQTIFKVDRIPQDSQLRDLIDECDPRCLEGIFSTFFRELQRAKQLEAFQVMDGYYHVVLDGTEYFSSDKIQCPQCLTKTSAKGHVRYHHQILQAAIVRHGKRQVIPLAPESIQNGDGSEKQDCEINAAKRMLKKIREAHPKLKIIIGGDGLYSKQPFVAALRDARMSYVLVAKPDDHKTLFEWVGELRRMGETGSMTATGPDKVEHRYEWANGVPINGDPKSDMVNFIEYRTFKKGKPAYHNTWITDHTVTMENVSDLARTGRTRWKIENETFNTLKNQGYHIEHNFGHGKLNLSYNFFLLNLLAFFFHQILAMSDPLYQKARSGFSARREYWNQLRCSIRLFVFKDWEELLLATSDPDNFHPP